MFSVVKVFGAIYWWVWPADTGSPSYGHATCTTKLNLNVHYTVWFLEKNCHIPVMCPERSNVTCDIGIVSQAGNWKYFDFEEPESVKIKQYTQPKIRFMYWLVTMSRHVQYCLDIKQIWLVIIIVLCYVWSEQREFNDH